MHCVKYSQAAKPAVFPTKFGFSEMKRMIHLLTQLKQVFTVSAILLLSALSANSQNAAGAYAGGDITYQMGNGDTLDITLNYYIECGGTSPGSNPILVLRNCSGTPISTVNMGAPTITEISNTTATTNCGAGTVSGRRRYQYTAQIDISDEFTTSCNFYRMTIFPTSRNPSGNLANATTQRLWLQADVYLQNDATNSSPTFTAQAIPYLCKNSTTTFSPEVSDVDGDSLVFSLVSAKTGTTSATAITYSTGSGTSPIAGITIDPTTGLLTFTSPDSLAHQVVILVQEYDRTSGNQISAVYRDFQFYVDTNCTNPGPTPNASFSNLTNVNSSVGNDTIYLDTNVAASFRLTFTDANGISGYTSNAVSVLGGNATFNSSNAQVSWTPSGADIGTHIFTISAEDNVTPTSGKGAKKVVVVVRDEVSPFVLTGAAISNVTCPNPENGTLVVQFTGGTGPFSFQIQGQFTSTDITQTSTLFTGLPSDNYKITMVDSGTGQDTTEIAFVHSILGFPFGINSISTLSTISCDDACNGSLRVNPNTLGAGGISNYSYLWSNGQTSRTATNLCGGTVGVTVTDTFGCQLTDTAALFEPPVVFAVVDSTDSASCNGAADGAAYISANGGVAASISTSEYIIDQSEGSFEPYPYGEAANVSNYSSITLGDDAFSAAINIGFSFEFFGETFTQFRISSNGFVRLGTAGGSTGVGAQSIPNAADPDNLIAGYWTDLNPASGGTIETYRAGTGSNEIRVINFIDVPHFLNVGANTFQIVLYESSNIIQVYLDSVTTDGGFITQGIEDSNGDTALAVTGRNQASFSAINDYVSFIPKSQDFNYTWSSIGTGASATNLTAGTYSVIAADDDGCGDTVNFTIEEPAQIDIDTVVTQPACSGDSTGIIAASATGGSGGTFTFAWSNGAATATITNLPAGIYTVTATDDTGCEDSLTVILTNPAALGVTMTPTDANCLGGNDGQILAAGTGGTSGTFTYLWSTGSTTNPLTGLTAGTYTVTATDGNGCTAVDSADVDEPATAVAVVADSTDESCSGAADGEANATGSEGTGTITYAWSNGGTSQTITGLTAGTYIVTATDANGCTAVDTTTVNAPASSVTVAIIDSTDVTCNGGNDGEAEVGNASGGTSPYTYLWNTGSTAQTITGLTAGTYTVTAQDNNGCEATDQVIIDEPATTVTVSITLDSNASCNGAADGGLTAVGSGGTGTITYAWSNSGNTASIIGLTADTYTVTATDANGCTATDDQIITEPNAVVASATSTPETCAGDDDGTATASGAGGSGTFTFSWNTGATSAAISSLPAGTYSVTVTDGNGCTDSTSVVIDPANAISITMTQDSVNCLNGSDGQATASATGGSGTFTYAWSNSGSGATITGLTADTYTVTATDGNGCTITGSIDVEEPASGVTASVTLDSNVSCFGETDGGLTAVGAGGSGTYTFSWNTTATTATIDGLGAATYSVTVTDANGCTDSASATITAPNQLFAFTSVLTTPTCNNTADGSVQGFGAGGTGTYTYEWSNGAATQTISSLTGGTYTVTVTDANGCTDDEDETLSAPNPIVITKDSINESCSGSADGEAYIASLTGGSSPYTFIWNTGSTNDTITGLTAGNYTVTVTDNNSCTEETTFAIDAGAGATVSADSTDITCNGDDDGTATATATGTGIITYAWSNGGTAASINSLATGAYTVTVTDANGCTAVDSTEVNEPAALVATASALLYETCTTNDGQATVSFSGAQGTPTFGWSNSATTQNITGLSASTYSVTVTDASGCTDSSSVVILDTCACSIVPSALVTTAPTCAGDSATVTASATGGSGTYTFLWPGGATSASTLLPAGTWCVTIDDGSCTDTACVIVSDPAAITFSAFSNVSQLTCDDDCDGAGTANASGGSGTLNYSWSSGANTAAATGLCGGTYTITVTDANGCTNTAMFALVEPPSIWVVVDSTDTASCGTADGEAYLSAYGGFAVPTSTAAYVVDSTEGEFEPYGIGQPLNANSYEVVTLQDDALSDTIEIFSGGDFSFFGSTETHFVICSQGFITFDASNINSGQVNGLFTAPSAIPSAGANTPQEFIAAFWTDLDPSVGAAQIETYEIGVTPNRARIVNFIDVTHFATGGNTDTNNFQIVLYENSNIIQIHSTQLREDGGPAVQGIENAAGTIAYGLSSRNNTQFDADNDYVAFIPTTQAFTYTWSSIGTGASATNLTAGTYNVTAADPNGCTGEVSFDIEQGPSTVDAGLAIDAGVSCTGTTNTGALSVSPSGGTGPYTRLWSTGATTVSISNLAAGTYSVIVTDANGCQDTAQVTLSATTSTIASPTILTNDTSVCAGTSLTLLGQTNSTSSWTDTTALLCTNTSGGVVTGVFSNVPPTAIGNATLSVTGFGDLDDGFLPENIAIIDENSGSVGTYDGSSTTCATQTETFTITQANINSWAANNVVSFVFDAGFFVTANTCSGNAFCVQAALTFPTPPDTSYWFGDPLNLDTALAIGFGDTVTVTPTTSTSFYYSTFNGVCWSEPDTVDVDTLPSVNVSIAQNTSISCPGDSASVTASATGGSGSLSFTWPTGETTATVSLPAGTWCVTVDDAGGTCSDTACVILVDPNTFTVAATGVDPLCNGGNNGSATATPTGGTGTITYAWSNSGTGATITGLTADTYFVTATDGNGCTATDSVVINDPALLVASATSTDLDCFGDNDGTTNATSTGGTGTVTFVWSNGSTGSALTGLTADQYSVTATDANGCTDSTSVFVIEPTLLVANIDSTDSNDCFGAAEGVAYASGSGGTTTYTFLWSTGSTSDTTSGLTAGSYTVTITDANGCADTEVAVITQPATGMTVTITNTDSASCFGAADGAATALAANAQGAVTYAWSSGDNAATTTSGLTAGTYNVTATDATGCTATTTATIEEPVEIVLNMSGNDPTCNGEDDGDASVTVASGGVGAITFSWSNGGAGSTITNLTADTYVVTATDANGCTASDTIILTNPAGITATFSGIVESSCTSCTGEATVTASGTATLTYAWPNGQTGTTATLLCDGINVLTITDGNGCLDSFNVAIPSDSADTIFSITGIDPLCNGGCDGQAYTTNSCATCTFVWTDSATSTTVSTSDTATGLCAGTYYVEMTNNGGCSTFDTVTLNDPAGINVPVPTSTDVSCLGGNDGTASATASGGTGTITFTWSNGASGANITGLTAGTYTVYATDGNGCSDSNSVVITQPTTGLSVVATVDSNVTCNGGNNGGASAVASGGSGTITYTWNGSLNGTPITGLTAGTYTVVVSDAGSCTATDTVTIAEPTAVVGVIDSTHNPTCPGDTNGAAFVSASGGSGTYTFLWPSGNTGSTETGLADGSYDVTITDANGCEDILSVVITDPAGMSNSFTGITTSSCTICDGQATANVTGGNGSNYTFIWGNGQITAANDSLCAGINGVTITDSLGCALEDFVPINADGADTVFADSIDATCGSCDGVAFATYNCNNGPCTLEWTAFGSSTVLATTDTLDSLCAGVYFASLTNNNGCTSIDQVTVVAPDPIDPNETIVDESCSGANDGSITLNTTGGSGTYTYTWSNGGTSATNTGLSAGTYTVTIADNAGCDSIAEFDIVAPTSITLVDTTTDASCFGICDGTISLTPSGGAGSFTFNWSPLPGNGQGVQAATGLCANDYFVTVTDANGCFIVDTITVAEPTEIIQTSVAVDSAECGVCDGAITQTVSGGAGGFTFLWNNGDTASSIDTLCVGYYDVTVTDANGCFEVFGHPVSETEGPEIILSSTITSAAGQCDATATVTIVNSQGTVSYSWSNGDTTATADSLCAGLVIVTVTDVNGCSTVDTITIIEPDLMTLSLASSEITCENGPCDGEIIASVTGGVTPYTFAWSNAATTDTITGLCAGTYVLTVTDANGAFLIDSVTLDNPSPFTVVSNVTELGCPGVCDGAISLNITGAGIPMLLWSTGDTTNTIDSLCAGTYTVTISDTSGCDDSLSFTLVAPPAITITVDSFTEPDCQVANGSISVSASGGTGSTYSYLWLDFGMTPLIPTQATSTASNLLAGIYNVQVTDSNGCQDTFNVILNNNNAPDIALDSIVNVSCFGECDGSISVTLTGGTTPYSILWSSGGTNEDDSNLCAGLDTIAVADANLCLSFEIYEVTEPEELFITGIDVVSVVCGSNCDGELTVHAEGGSGPYSYSWSNGAVDSSITGLCAGLYNVTITDANGCTVEGSANVGGSAAMVLTVDSTNDATCTYTGDGNVFVTITGGTPGYTYSWMADDSTTFSAQDLNNVLSGTYMLTITDAAGCSINDTFIIDALNFVSVTAEDDIEVCPDSRGIAIVGEDSLATSVRWLNELGIVQSTSRTAVVDITEDTTMFIFEGTNGLCVARDTILILETDGPGIDAGNDRTIEPGDEVVIGGDPTARNGVEVTWTPDADITSTTVLNPMVNPLKTTTYYVSGIDGDECYGIDSVVITVEKLVDPVGGFSPNGDGVNDLFFIDRINNFPEAKVQIFNRWGNLLFTSDAGYTKPWNGKYNGNVLTIGTYYYVIDLNVDGEDVITGPVTILK